MFHVALLTFLAAASPTRSWSNDELLAACSSTEKNAAACERLARRHLTGRGAAKDLPKAAELFTVACEDQDVDHPKDAGACTQLGAMLYTGNGVPKNHHRARWAFRIACDAEGPSACASLAQMTRRGLGGVEKSADEATLLDQQACALGWKRSC